MAVYVLYSQTDALPVDAEDGLVGDGHQLPSVRPNIMERVPTYGVNLAYVVFAVVAPPHVTQRAVLGALRIGQHPGLVDDLAVNLLMAKSQLGSVLHQVPVPPLGR